MGKPGLRERKKQATRRMIADIASGLFVQRGFDNVTVAEIAEAAGVSKMTVFNYFPRKEDLFLDRYDDRLRELEQAIRERPPGEGVLAALRRYHQELLTTAHPLSGVREGVGPFFLIVRSSPALTARSLEHEREVREMLTQVLAEELADRTDAELAAAMITAASNSAFEHAVNRIIDGDDVEEIRRDQAVLLDRAFDLLERGLGQLSWR